MAEETLVKEVLTKAMIQAGADLIRRLDEARLRVSASLWLYIPEVNLWRLVIASPAVREDGPRKVYQKIQSILSMIGDDESTISLQDIRVVEPDDPLLSLLRISLKTGGDIAGRRWSKNAINGHVIEDMYIYRVT